MKKILVLLTLFISLIANATSPRMWEVSGKVKDGIFLKFYILGVSHNGLDAEYDDYFYNKVIPIFDMADVFSREASDWLPALAPECPTRLKPTASNKKMIEMAREQVRVEQKALLDVIPRTLLEAATKEERDEQDREDDIVRSGFAKAMADGYTELGLIWARRILYQQQESLDANTDSLKISLFSHQLRVNGFSKSASLHPQIVTSLYERRPRVKLESIDSTQDIVDAYCTLGIDRAKLFQKKFDEWNYKNGNANFSEIAKSREKNNFNFKKSLEVGKISGYLLKDVDEDKAYVCTRNLRWLDKMINHPSQGITFYALGLAHLLPRADGKHSCDDLLTSLRKVGLTVNPIE